MGVLFWIGLFILVLILILILSLQIISLKFVRDDDILDRKKLVKLHKNSDYNFEFYKGTLVWNNIFGFMIFSFYFGLFFMGNLSWTFKEFKRTLKMSKKYAKKGNKSLFIWRKISKGKKHVYYPYVLLVKKM